MLVTSWRENPGYCPDDARGRRVLVRLRNGTEHGGQQVTVVSKLGWAADGRDACNWALDPPGVRSREFNIAHYKVI